MFNFVNQKNNERMIPASVEPVTCPLLQWVRRLLVERIRRPVPSHSPATQMNAIFMDGTVRYPANS
jgi:hypothetical protein